MRLLLIEDDEKFLEEMRAYFADDFAVRSASSLTNAKQVLTGGFVPDCAILDLILPDGNGLSLLTDKLLTCPTVILTSVVSDLSVIDGMDAGAEDYVFKPCSMPVLAKRLERRLPGKNRTLRFGDLVIDSVKRTVSYREIPIKLTSLEFNILYFLAMHENKLYTVTEIYEAVWDMPALNSKSGYVHLHYLKQKLSKIAKNEDYIQSDFGRGYRFSSGDKLNTDGEKI